MKGSVRLQITPGATFARGRGTRKGSAEKRAHRGGPCQSRQILASSSWVCCPGGQVNPKGCRTITKTWSFFQVDRPKTFCTRRCMSASDSHACCDKEMIAPGGVRGSSSFLMRVLSAMDAYSSVVRGLLLRPSPAPRCPPSADSA
jgi:hypothetical protein